MAEGKFIVFEGIDGSGITTQAGLLREWFLKEGQQVYLAKEPSEGPAGLLIRLALSERLGYKKKKGWNGLGEQMLALLFAADRLDHLENDIGPRLRDGVNVVADRYYLSSFSYQALHAELEWLVSINSKCRAPDLTIYFEVPPAVAEKRIQVRWQHQMHEHREMLRKVQRNYKEAIRLLTERGERIVQVDGNAPMQTVHRAVVRHVKDLLAGKMPPPTSRPEAQLALESVDLSARVATP